MKITVTASKKSKRHFVIKASSGTTEQMLDAFENRIAELEGEYPVESATYIDVGGGFGEVGEKYTDEDLRAIWDEDHEGDPSMAEYGEDFDQWYSDTINNFMKRVDDEDDYDDVEGGCHGGTKKVESATILETDLSDAYMMMCYEPGTAEEGIEGDSIYPMCIFRANDIDDARVQVAKYCEDNGLDSTSYYADYYNPEMVGDDNADESVFDSLADYANYEDSAMEAEQIDEDLDEITALDASTDIKAYTDPDSAWEILERKQVPDSDGFYTDYTLYHNILTDQYGCMFGDVDLYSPEEGYFDWEGNSEEEAYEWFESYTGFEDDEDIYSSEEIDDKKEDVDDKVDEDADDETKEDINGKQDVMCSIELTEEQQTKLDEIAERYVTSEPVSGDWDKEAEHEQKAISDELGVSMDDAKQIMKDYLGFED